MSETFDVLSYEYDIGDKKEVLADIINWYKTITPHFTTMYQDVINQRETEIDFLNGYIIELAVKNNDVAPLNRQMFKQIKQIEKQYLKS